MEDINNTNDLLTSERRIVICGSMGAYGLMKKIRSELIEKGVRAIVPEAEDNIKPSLSSESFSKFKRNVSYAYLKKIKDPRTIGVLAVNPDKYDIPDYIGPNTFAEIAVAFAQSKKIYILNGFPDVYEDELNAWRGIQLNGDLTRLIAEYNSTQRTDNSQLQLFSTPKS